MKYTEALSQGIAKKDLNGIRAALIGYLDVGADGANILCVADSVAKEIGRDGIDLFVPDDGRCNFDDINSDTKQKLINIKARLRSNFSREKIAYAEKLLAQTIAPDRENIIPISRKNISVTAPVASENINSLRSENELKLPADLQKAVDDGERSSVIAILMGLLDIFDKDEALPVIEYASLCDNQLKAKGIKLFDPDDDRIDFTALPLTDETLISLKAKLRLNFSLEKMIFAEKIFQLKLAEKQSQVSQEAITHAAVMKESTPDAEAAAPENIENDLGYSASSSEPVPPQECPFAESTSTPSGSRDHGYSSCGSREEASADTPPLARPSSRTNTYLPSTKIVYQPGPLESLFGKVGRFFDKLFGNEGKNIRRPRR